MGEKLILSHRGALLRKYGKAGLAAITKALVQLIKADKARGLATRTVFLDDAAQMARLRARPVPAAGSCRDFKTAIDGVYQSQQPDYLMILGAPDVVPHQDLVNPVFGEGVDDDACAWGDLPYACDAAYSRDPARFVGPTRVLGRLPDLQGAAEPDYLLALIKAASQARPLRPADYRPCFALSAEVWQGSSRLSLQNIVGEDAELQLSPSAGPRHAAPLLKRRLHFINCHGSQASPEFLGEAKNGKYPAALNSAALARHVSPGTLASVECCYGADLYDSLTLALELPIGQSYLQQGAYGYFGSTTIAYGPADGNGAADLISQFFLLQALAGASTGRAALLARQQFVQQAAQMDPIDLKTLAQFVLLGDPSIQPVQPEQQAQEDEAAHKARSLEPAAMQSFARAERRAQLKAVGQFLQKTKPTAARELTEASLPPGARIALAQIAKLAGLPASAPFKTFLVQGSTAPAGLPSGARKTLSTPARYHLGLGKKPAAKNDGSVHLGVAVLAKESGGKIVGYRIYHQR